MKKLANLTAEQAQAIINRLVKEKKGNKGYTGLKKKTHTFSVVLTEQDYEELRDMAYELGDATAVLARKFVLKGIREMRKKMEEGG